MNLPCDLGPEETFKSVQAARVAALLGWQACMSHDRLGAWLFGDVSDGLHYFTPYRSTKSLLAMFKQLSRADVNQNAPFISLDEALVHVNKAILRGTLIYIISDFGTVSVALEQQLSTLRRRCDIVLIPIDDPADQSIPPIGPVFFSACNQDKLYIDTNNQMGRENYAAQWLETRQSLLKIATKLKIGMIPIATDANAQAELFHGLKRIRKEKRKR